MAYELTELDKACLGYEIEDYSRIRVLKGHSGEWKSFHAACVASIVSAWTLNKVAALNRCERGEKVDEWLYVPCYDIGQDGTTSWLVTRYQELGIRITHGNVIREFYTEKACVDAIASIGGEEIMVKVLQTLERMF
jgi:hypothetical protein